MFRNFNRHNGTNGIIIKFNPKNKYGEPCCCEKGYLTKFSSSTWFCTICNLFRCRRLFRTSSWCKKVGWDKTCTTCQQMGLYNQPRDGKTSLYTDEQIAHLVTVSEEIRALCIDECRDDHMSVFHHLPLKDKEKHPLDETNWDLPEDQIRKIKQGIKELTKYANYICERYGEVLLNKDATPVFTEDLLPRWIVFPLYSKTALGWRMGIGEDYAELMWRWHNTLTEEAFNTYQEKYPAPRYWKYNERRFA